MTGAAKPLDLASGSRPILARGVCMREDTVRGRTVLLAPERTVALDAIGVAILSAMDGKRTLGTIVEDLANRYEAPRDVIARDVHAYLRDLANRRYLDLVR
jgi:pyrroloquinoline quinone biosynthesis protein D